MSAPVQTWLVVHATAGRVFVKARSSAAARRAAVDLYGEGILSVKPA